MKGEFSLFYFLFLSSDHLKVDGDKLYLSDVKHFSDGVYQCAAENRHGMLASATWVYVHGKRIWEIQWENNTIFICSTISARGRQGGRERELQKQDQQIYSVRLFMTT